MARHLSRMPAGSYWNRAGYKAEEYTVSYQSPQQRRIATAQIVAIYALFGLAWIYGSDTVLGLLIDDPDVRLKVSVVKGSLFILSTAALLYFLINRFVKQLTAAESARMESLKDYQAIFNATNEAIFIHDARSGRILDVNDRMLEMYGYKREEALAADIGQLSAGTPPYSQTEAVEKLRKAMIEGPQVFEWLARKKDGELFWSEVSIKRITSNDYDRIIVVGRDIRERKLADDALRTSEERNRIILNSAMDGFWRVSPQGRLLEVNEAYCRMSGYSRQELLAMSIADLEVNETADDAADHNRKIMEQGEDRFVSQHRRKDGTVFDVEVSAKFIPIDGGQFVGFQRDITEQKRAEESLWNERAFLRSLIDAASDLIYFKDRNSIYLGCNRASETFTGLLEQDQIGKSDFDFFEKEIAEQIVKIDQKVLEGGVAIRVEEWVASSAAGSSLLETVKAPIFGKEGQPIGLVGISRDITERKQAEMELLQAKTDAESANRTKSQFLATMSHEIRTPMNGIISIAQILEMTELTQEQKEYVDILKQSGNNLLKLISDILDLSRIEAGKVELETEDFDLKDEITGTASIFSLLAQGKGLEFSFLINPDVPLLLKGDMERLRQIITNLIGNAIKFTSKGSISLHISKDIEDEQHATLRFQICDSGIGIGPDNIGSIFEAFRQADSSTSRKYGGTGLGLTIAHYLVELMGGSVGVESMEGEGATFWFTAVLAKQTKAPDFTALEKVADASGVNDSIVRILLVEDDTTNQFAISRLLSKYGYQVDVAGDGREGLKLLVESDYALVLMDCMMPVLDGYEATAAIRDRTSSVRNHAIPVIALTANAMREDRDKCLAAGMDDYISKPIVVPLLLATLEKWSKPTGRLAGPCP